MPLDYAKIAPAAVAAMGQTHRYLHDAWPDKRLQALVEMRVSQINGCAYCMDMHATQARAAGESQQRLDVLPGWRETDFFNDREKLALEWAEAITLQNQHHIPEGLLERVSAAFSEKEVVDLTVIIAMMNAWNRLAVPLHKSIGRR
jgi:AhpD family alkylhydroperoxidase